MIRLYVKEFVGICGYLEAHDCRKRQACFLVEREQLEELLKKNNYEQVRIKLQRWRRLGWLQADEGHLTKRFYIKEQHCYRRMYVLNIEVSIVLKEIQNSQNDND